jgi:iron complex transport system substrate-binding protein
MQRHHRRLALLAAIGLIGPTFTSAAASAAPTPTTTETTAPAPPGMQTIIDQDGRSVTIPVNITRIATNYPALPTMIYMLHGIGNVVATSTNAETPLLQQIDPAVAQIPTPFSGSSINTEALLATNPQVIFVAVPSASTILPIASQLGIPVVEFAQFDGPQQLEQGVTLMAKILGTPEAALRAKQYATYYNNNVKEALAVTHSIPLRHRPTVYYATQNELTTEGLGSIVTVWINEAGGQNVAAKNGLTQGNTNNYPTLTVEQLLQWDPEIIVAGTVAIQQQILADPAVATLAAVKDHRVYVAPQGIFAWQVRGPESAMMPLWALSILHPKLLPKLNMTNVTEGFYHLFYNTTLSTAQITQIINPALVG